MTTKSEKPLEIGWEEWIALPELKLPAIRAKVDTGAKTSALHAFMVEKLEGKGDVKVRFGIHPIPDRPEVEIYCTAHLVDEREVTSSNGQTELRYVIRTMAQFGQRRWPIEITLTDRETMAYRMLIGRSAMEKKLVVVPGRSFVLGAISANVYDHVVSRRKKRSLNIGILSHIPDSYSAERFSAVAESRGHKVEVLNATRCYVDISADKPNIHYQGTLLSAFDAVIPLIGQSRSSAFYGLSILRQLESLGYYCINSPHAIAHARDALLAYQLLNRAGIPMPPTAFAQYPGDIKDMIKIVGGAPLVIKLVNSPKNGEPVLAQTNKAAIAVMQAFRGLNANFIAQKQIERVSKAIQCVVLGGKVIAAFERLDNEVGLSKTAAVKVKGIEIKLAVRAARVLALKFALVHLLRTSTGPCVMQVVETPALRVLERVTGEDIALRIIEFIETHARPRLPKRVVGYHF